MGHPIFLIVGFVLAAVSADILRSVNHLNRDEEHWDGGSRIVRGFAHRQQQNRGSVVFGEKLAISSEAARRSARAVSLIDEEANTPKGKSASPQDSNYEEEFEHYDSEDSLDDDSDVKKPLSRNSSDQLFGYAFSHRSHIDQEAARKNAAKRSARNSRRKSG